MNLSVKGATGPHGSVSTTLVGVSDKIRSRIDELMALEEKLYAQINQVIGMRLAFEEVLEMEVSELSFPEEESGEGGSSDPSSFLT